MGEPRYIRLTNGGDTAVDELDYVYLSRWDWREHPKGYVVRGERTGGRYGRYENIRMHRVVAERMGLPVDEGRVDHKDTDTLNNQRLNFRMATPSQNGANSRPTRGHVYKGVARRPCGSYQASIKVDRASVCLGTYSTAWGAAQAYNVAAKKYFGEFARLNEGNTLMAVRTENRREFLQLSHVFDPAKASLAGWFMSDKLDGMRCFWDAGITRGMYAHEVPWANTEKDHIRVNPPKCTGLWSRYAKPIQAPMWFLDQLPPYPLDGELYLGPQRFEEVMSTVRRLVPDDAQWKRIGYHVFDLPDYSRVFAEGNCSNPQMKKEIKGVFDWLHNQKVCKWTPADAKTRRFETVQFLLNRDHPPDGKGIVKAVPQTQLPFSTAKAVEVVNARLDEVVKAGGEGLILRNLNSIWEPQRSWNVLKVKPFNDAEVRVRGYVWGRETDKGSKLLGMMGALVTDFKGKRLELSGFTDAEREMLFTAGTEFKAEGHRAEVEEEGLAQAGKDVDVTRFTSRQFPINCLVTIRYRELTAAGLPKEARYWRHRAEAE